MGADGLIIDLPEDFDYHILDNYEIFGISSGASVPKYIVNKLVENIKKRYPHIQIFQEPTVEKDILFPLPKEVSDMRP